MEIQSPTVAPVASNGAASASSGGSAAAGNASNGSFAVALNGMMTDGSASTETGEGISGLAALVQLLNPIQNAVPLTDEQAAAQGKEQLDGLIGLLQQLQSDGETAQELTDNPELQNWLAELQLLFNPLTLSQPVVTEAATAEGQGDIQSSAISLTQAIELLQQLKSQIADGKPAPHFEQLMKELPSVLASAAANTGDKQKSELAKRLSAAVPTASQDAKSNDVSNLVQSTSGPVKGLEVLASKHHITKALTEQSPSDDTPLFEPLASGDNGSSQPIPVHELLRQAQPAQTASKTVSLQMPASSFTEEMTKFAVGSFLLKQSADGFTEAKISLYPQHLGHVDVKLSMHNGQLIAQFVADSAAGKEMLESQMSQLRTSLQNQGIQVDKLEVSQSQGFQSGMFQDGRQQQSQQSSKQQRPGGGKVEAMDEDLIEKTAKADKTPSSDGSIDITA